MQKEAFFYRVPWATLREEKELVEPGWDQLVPPREFGYVASALLEGPWQGRKDILPFDHG